MKERKINDGRGQDPVNMEAAWLGRRSGAKDPDDWNRS